LLDFGSILFSPLTMVVLECGDGSGLNVCPFIAALVNGIFLFFRSTGSACVAALLAADSLDFRVCLALPEEGFPSPVLMEDALPLRFFFLRV